MNLSDYQIDLLRMLEEAGAETLPTVLNTFNVSAEPSSGCPDYAFQRGIATLVRNGYVEWLPATNSDHWESAHLDPELGYWGAVAEVSLASTAKGASAAIAF